MKLTDLCAPIPAELRPADDLLHLYGRWAKDRAVLHRCGSAEREYRAPQDDEDRQPRPVLMHVDLAMACQRALAGVPEKERKVLAVLYVPKKMPPDVQLRIMRVPPKLCQERQLLGLRMFTNRMKRAYTESPFTENASRVALRQPSASAKWSRRQSGAGGEVDSLSHLRR